nr:immunoglobulin heavy chain junction region [Macaca mulatta]MOX59203.1 immunoglobulin heavy chain junction region [Macaca mulatta]MOX61012.1 immunoglobulin heavy chain junction region [Macaca mulatta]MOX63435.1 immunoglobulin heavy chain junction region [Macaca mulatta]MOX63561.1 immunoglobulin heavy chain junction region [Macaca mulatta]
CVRDSYGRGFDSW